MPLKNVTHPFYAIENQYIPSMPLFLIFHFLYAIGVKNTNGAVKLKGKRAIIPLAPIPCPLSTTTDVWDHTSDSSSTLNPSDPRWRRRARRARRRPVLPLRRGRRRASRRSLRALRRAPAAAAVKQATTRAASSATGRPLRRTPAPAPSCAAFSAAATHPAPPACEPCLLPEAEGGRRSRACSQRDRR